MARGRRAASGRQGEPIVLTWLLIAALGHIASDGVDRALTTAEWMPLIEKSDFAAARSRCESYLNASDTPSRAEAHKCLANIELAGATGLEIQGDRQGGFIGTSYRAAPAHRAVEHLNQAVLLAPGDLGVHQGRLHVLMLAGLREELARALDESIRLYKGDDALAAWLAYPA